VGFLFAVVFVKNLAADGADYVTRPGFSLVRSVVRAAFLQTPPVPVAHILHASLLDALPPAFRRFADISACASVNRAMYKFEPFALTKRRRNSVAVARVSAIGGCFETFAVDDFNDAAARLDERLPFQDLERDGHARPAHAQHGGQKFVG
jgi:hypothetical protein